MAASDQCKEACHYQGWMNLQEEELSELNQAATRCTSNVDLSRLVEKIMTHFEDYSKQRSLMARVDVSPYFAPTWCSSLERSVLWIGGCRPSSHIRLIYALCGLEIEAQLTQLLHGVQLGSLGQLSASQLAMVDELQRKTIRGAESLFAPRHLAGGLAGQSDRFHRGGGRRRRMRESGLLAKLSEIA